MQTTAFTIKSNIGIQRVLVTQIIVVQSGQQNGNIINGIWDTGATGTAITTSVVKRLGLVPTGIVNVSTAAGVVQQNTYSIDIVLPNKIRIQGIVATEVPQLSGDCDALIGMDIITLGDFSITNHKGTTCMSFRVPSSHEIDYVKSPDFGIVKVTHTKNFAEKMRQQNLQKIKNKKKK